MPLIPLKPLIDACDKYHYGQGAFNVNAVAQAKDGKPDFKPNFEALRDIILDRIWGLESDVSSNNIDSYMKILRKKLDLGDGGTVIKTVRGVGYKLEARS